MAPAHVAKAVFEQLGGHDPGLIESWSKLDAERDAAGFYELLASEAV